MPDNVWLGVSIIGVEDWYRILDLARNKARIKFVSLEPFIGTRPNIIAPLEFDLLIIGRLTGRGCKHDPSRHDIQKIVDDCREHKIAVFLKNNLSGIWPGRLIQEFPR
jgi:protein gp37